MERRKTCSETLIDVFDKYINEEKKFGKITRVGVQKDYNMITKFIVGYIDEYDDEECEKYISVDKVLSRKFGFIKWLLDKGYLHPEDDMQRIYTSGAHGEYEYKRDAYDTVLMWLSIQDDPMMWLWRMLRFEEEDE